MGMGADDPGRRRGRRGDVVPLRLPRLALIVGCLAAGACSRTTDRPSAVLITLDTTRADALGCFGGRPGITPRLDAFARECIAYDEAATTAPLTLPAHASMLTGLYPPRHGVRDNLLTAVPPEALTLAELARDSGCATAAFVSASVLERPWGLAQGFDVYDEPGALRPGPLSHVDERSSPETVGKARAWLRGRDRTRPFFLWVHVYDAHSPYRPDARFLAQAGGDAYRGEIAEADDSIGKLLDELRADPSWGRTTVLVAADHGESLGEHGEPTHSILCYRACLRVPFLVRHPDGWRAGEHSHETVSVVDAFPTLAAALGLVSPPGIDGIDLDHHAVGDDRGAYFESYAGYLNHGWSPIVGWIDRRGKYVDGGAPEYYAFGTNPAESNDLAGSGGVDLARYRARIAEVAAGTTLPIAGSTVPEDARRAQAGRLGYAAAGDASKAPPKPLEPTGLPLARDRMSELAAYYAAVDRANAGDLAGSIAGLQTIVETNPGNVAALDMMGALLIRLGRWGEARAALERMLAKGPDRVTTRTNLGRCCENAGDLAQALVHYRRALELKPGAPDQAGDVARVTALLR
jgi:choline-sulfatase